MDVNRREHESRLLDTARPRHRAFISPQSRVKPDEFEAPSWRTPFQSVANWSCEVDTPRHRSLSRFLVRAGVVVANLTLLLGSPVCNCAYRLQ